MIVKSMVPFPPDTNLEKMLEESIGKPCFDEYGNEIGIVISGNIIPDSDIIEFDMRIDTEFNI